MRSKSERSVRATVTTIALLAALFVPGRAEARVQRDVDYRFDQVWGTLVRLLRVDYRYPVDEQDEPHGFVLFRFMEYGRSHTASVELVRVPDSDSRVRLVVQVEGVPAHMEAQILDDLERKLRVELGRPARPIVVADRETAPSTVPRLRDRPEDDERPRGNRDQLPTDGDGTQPTEPSATQPPPTSPPTSSTRERRR